MITKGRLTKAAPFMYTLPEPPACCYIHYIDRANSQPETPAMCSTLVLSPLSPSDMQNELLLKYCC